MYMWMDHMMSAEANGQATVYFGEAPTSQEACDYAETIAPGHCEQTHATDEAYWEDIWYWSTAREDCADDDADTTCVDFDGWVEAWTTLAGRLSRRATAWSEMKRSPGTRPRGASFRDR